MIVQREMTRQATKAAEPRRQRILEQHYTEVLCIWAQKWENVGSLPTYEKALESEQKPISWSVAFGLTGLQSPSESSRRDGSQYALENSSPVEKQGVPQGARGALIRNTGGG